MEKRIEHLVRLGGRVAISPYVEARTKLAFLKDPNGTWIEPLARAKVARK